MDQPKSIQARADRPLQVVHFDLFGPCKHSSFVFPDIFNDDNKVAPLFNVVLPDTFNDDSNETLLFNVV